MSPCKNCRSPGLLPQSLGNCLYVTLFDKDTIFPYIGHFFLKPKYQFSLRGNIKDRRDLRGGVDFETPSLWFTRFGRACPRQAR